jgi:hypothetical protein
MFPLLGKIVKALKLKTPFRGGVPGKDWFAGFQKRHPELALRKPEASSTQRLRAINTSIVGDHFSQLNDVLCSPDIPLFLHMEL